MSGNFSGKNLDEIQLISQVRIVMPRAFFGTQLAHQRSVFCAALFLVAISCATAVPAADNPIVEGKDVSDWIRLARDTSADARAKAIGALGEFLRGNKDPDGRAWYPIVLGLNDPDKAARLRAIAIFAERCDAKSVNSLRVVLDSPDKETAEAARKAVRRIAEKHRDEIETQIDLLSSIDGRDRTKAARALASFGPAATAALPALIPIVEQGDVNATMDVNKVLASFGPDAAGAVPALLELASKGKDFQQQSAIHTLAAIGPAAKEAIPLILDRMSTFDETTLDDSRQNCGCALLDIDPTGETWMPKLRALLASPNDNLRWAAVDALRKIAIVLPSRPSTTLRTETATALAGALGDKSLQVPWIAADGLAGLGPSAVAAVPALAKAIGSDVPDLSDSAGRALIQMGVPGMTALIKLREDKDEKRRFAALSHLSAMPRQAMVAARETLRAENAHARPDVTWAVETLEATPQRILPMLLTARAENDPKTKRVATMGLNLMAGNTKKPMGELRGIRTAELVSLRDRTNKAIAVIQDALAKEGIPPP